MKLRFLLTIAIFQSLNTFAQCEFFIAPATSCNGCIKTVEEVTFTNLQNVVSAAGSLTKTQNGNSWNAGGSSAQRVYESGSAQTIIDQTNTERFFGLSSNDNNVNPNGIGFAFHLQNNGTMRIRESGNDRGNMGSYSLGDTLKIVYAQGLISYLRNSEVLYVSTLTPPESMVVDISFRQSGGRFNKVSIHNTTDNEFTASTTGSFGWITVYFWTLDGVEIGENSPTITVEDYNEGSVLQCTVMSIFGGCHEFMTESHDIILNPALATTPFDFCINALPADNGCTMAREEVKWDSEEVQNLAIDENNLEKIQGGNNWNGGAASINTVSNNGYFEFSTAENNRAKMIGLSNTNNNSGENSIRYAFHLENNGNLRIRENGNDRGNVGTYQAGDEFKIAADLGEIKYFKNNELLYISSLNPSFPLLADVSINQVGGTVTNAFIRNFQTGTFIASVQNAGPNPTFQWKLNGVNTGTNSAGYTNTELLAGDLLSCELIPDISGCNSSVYYSNEISIEGVDIAGNLEFYISGTAVPSGCIIAAEDVQWDIQETVHLSINQNNLEKIQGGNSWNGGSASHNSLSNNGTFVFSTLETNRRKIAGLSSQNNNSNENSIRYAFLMEPNGNLRIRENGNDRGNFGTYQVGDSLKINIANNTVQYFRNSDLLYISALEPTFPLIADVSLHDIGATITDAYFLNFNGGTYTANANGAGLNPTFQWKLNGANVGSNSSTYTNEFAQDGDIISCELSPDLGGCSSTLFTSNHISLSLEDAASISFYISGDVAESGCQSAIEDVQWDTDDLVNISATANNLEKIQGGNTWNGGAASLNTVADNGYFEFTSLENNRRKMVGLSSVNNGVSENAIRYAFLLEPNGNLRIREAGNDRGNFGTFQPNDILKIGVENTTVRYYRNGELLYISNLNPTLPLLVDISIHDVGGTVRDAVIANYNQGAFTAYASGAGINPVFQWKLNGTNVGTNSSNYLNEAMADGDVLTCELSPDLGGCNQTVYTSNEIIKVAEVDALPLNFYAMAIPSAEGCTAYREDIVWNSDDLVNVELNGNNLVKLQGGNTWNGGAASVNTVHNNGYFEFSTEESNRRKMVGLSQANFNSSENNIRYAFHLEPNGNLRIRESGNDRGNFGTYAAGDVFRIAVENQDVKYYRNSNLLYISTLTPAAQLIADLSIHDLGGTVSNAKISNVHAGAFKAVAENAGENPLIQWILNGNPVGGNTDTYTNTSLGSNDIVSCEIVPDLGGCSAATYTSGDIEIEVRETAFTGIVYSLGQVDQSAQGMAIEEVVWETASLNNVEANGSDLIKIQSNGIWDGGAASHNRIYDNGYMEMVPSETNRRRMVGLSSTNNNSNFNSIRYAFYLEANGNLKIYEAGTDRGNFGNYNSNTVLRIAVESGVVRYYRNGILLRTAPAAPNLPLLVDVSIRDIGGTVTNLVVANRNSGTFNLTAINAGNNPQYQWKLNGVSTGTNAPVYVNNNLFDGDLISCTVIPDLDGCSSVNVQTNEIRYETENPGTQWIGAVSNAWNNAANWSNGVPTQTTSVRVPQGTPFAPMVNIAAEVFEMVIDQNAALSFQNGNSLRFYGNLINNGSMNCTGGSVVFTGAGSRSVSGNTVRFERLLVNLTNATDSVILQNNMEIAIETVFLRGLIVTGSNELVYIDGSDTRTGLNESYVDGVCRKIGNEPFIFPVGKDGIYAPLQISAPALPTDAFTGTYIIGNPENASYDHSEQDGSLAKLSSCEYWILNRVAGNSPVTVGLSYQDERSCGVNDPNLLCVARWNGSQWQNHGYGSHEGDELAGTVFSATAIPNFSPFTLGSGSSINPLPIELLEFNAYALKGEVTVEWSTSTERNNDFFTIERSSNAVDFEPIGYVNGAGSSNSRLNYAHIDKNPIPGTSYYRLKQTDFDGTSETFEIKAVQFTVGKTALLYPNPNRGEFTVEIPGGDGTYYWSIRNTAGIPVQQGSSNQVRLPISMGQMAPGIYFFEMQSGGEITRTKFILVP